MSPEPRLSCLLRLWHRFSELRQPLSRTETRTDPGHHNGCIPPTSRPPPLRRPGKHVTRIVPPSFLHWRPALSSHPCQASPCQGKSARPWAPKPHLHSLHPLPGTPTSLAVTLTPPLPFSDPAPFQGCRHYRRGSHRSSPSERTVVLKSRPGYQVGTVRPWQNMKFAHKWAGRKKARGCFSNIFCFFHAMKSCSAGLGSTRSYCFWEDRLPSLNVPATPCCVWARP